MGYASGKHKTLDDAFGESRPSHWRQDKRNFELEHGFEIVELVNDLCNAGAVKPDVFYTVGEKFHKDGGVIKGIYYSSRKVRQRLNEEVKSINEVVRRTSNMWSLKLHLEGVYEAVGLLLAHDMCLEDALAAVARLIATTAIDAAIAAGGDAGKIATAQAALTDGDSKRASGDYKDAVGKYKDAVANAEGA